MTRRAAPIGRIDRGDFVVVGRGVGTVVGGREVIAVVVRTVVGTVVAGAVTVNVFTPTYPFTSLKYTSYIPGFCYDNLFREFSISGLYKFCCTYPLRPEDVYRPVP